MRRRRYALPRVLLLLNLLLLLLILPPTRRRDRRGGERDAMAQSMVEGARREPGRPEGVREELDRPRAGYLFIRNGDGYVECGRVVGKAGTRGDGDREPHVGCGSGHRGGARCSR
eukprot:6752720-Pyramimonas_sp.AAC.1